MLTSVKNFKLFSIFLITLFFVACSESGSENSEARIAYNIMGGKPLAISQQQAMGVVGIVTTYFEPNEKYGTIPGEPKMKKIKATCSGSLISSKLVLTAHHCIRKRNLESIMVVFGTDLKSITAENMRYMVEVKIMGSYNPNSVDFSGSAWNDLALIVLQYEAPEGVVPVTLANSKLNFFNPNGVLTLAGFGNTKKDGNESGVLRSVDGVKIQSINVDKKEIMLDLEGGRKGACHGDSGGPAFYKAADGKYIQVGLGSRVTNSNGECNKSIVYTLVTPYLDWINSTLKSID